MLDMNEGGQMFWGKRDAESPLIGEERKDLREVALGYEGMEASTCTHLSRHHP